MRIRALLCGLSIAVCLFGRQPVRSRTAMVVAQEPLAADAGVAVLKAGAERRFEIEGRTRGAHSIHSFAACVHNLTTPPEGEL